MGNFHAVQNFAVFTDGACDLIRTQVQNLKPTEISSEGSGGNYTSKNYNILATKIKYVILSRIYICCFMFMK